MKNKLKSFHTYADMVWRPFLSAGRERERRLEATGRQQGRLAECTTPAPPGPHLNHPTPHAQYLSVGDGGIQYPTNALPRRVRIILSEVLCHAEFDTTPKFKIQHIRAHKNRKIFKKMTRKIEIFQKSSLDK